MKSKLSSEQMRNVKLSDGTKEYLVAYKAAEKATTIVVDQVNETWGNEQGQEMVKPMFEALYRLQDEILRLMMKEIDENLAELNCTEI